MANQHFLRLTLSWDEYGSGEITVSAVGNGFCGVSSAWVTLDEIESFAVALEAYPLPTAKPPSFAAQYYKQEEDGINQASIYLAFYPIGSLGRIGIHIVLAPQFIMGERPESRHRAELEIETTYQELSYFIKELRHLARGEAREAVLGDWVEP